MKSGILKNKEFGEPDCRRKNGIDEFVILVQCSGYFLRESWRWQLFTASRGFVPARSCLFFLFIKTIPLLSCLPPNSFYFITRLIEIAARVSCRCFCFLASPLYIIPHTLCPWVLWIVIPAVCRKILNYFKWLQREWDRLLSRKIYMSIVLNKMFTFWSILFLDIAQVCLSLCQIYWIFCTISTNQ